MTIVWSGLAVGAIYSLVAIGYNVVLLASGIFNFAYAQLLMLGVYMAYVGSVNLRLPVILVVALSCASVAVFALVQEFTTIRPLIAAGRDPHSTLVVTVGVAILVRGIATRIWGVEPLSIPAPLSTKSLKLLGGTIAPTDLLLIGLVLVVGLGLHLLSRHTLVGLAALASTENRDAAMLRGINVRRLGWAAFVLSGMVAGALALFVGSRTYAVNTLGDDLAIYGFVAIAIGGSGSQIGGLFGGFGVGLSYALIERYTGSSNAPAILVFAVFLTLLLVRPHGIFGAPQERQV